MTSPITLHLHPLSSFCWKVLAALYENDTPFTPNVVDLSNPKERAALAALWPFAKFPVIEDHANHRVVAESTTIIEYLAAHHPGKIALVPADAELAREVRFRDRFFDLYVHVPMQKIVGDIMRAEGKHDLVGVGEAKASITTAYDVLEREMAAKTWAVGDAFTMADCAAGPALYYANRVHPFGDARKNVGAYLARVLARPSFVRVLAEAAPYFAMFPG